MNQPTSQTSLHLRDPRLIQALRWLTGAVILASIALIALNIPIFYQYVIERAQVSAVLDEIISPYLLAAIRTVIRRFGELLLLSLAILTWWRSYDVRALVLAMFAAMFAATYGGSYAEVSERLPALALPLTLVAMLPGALAALLLFTLPDGKFQPAWGRVVVIMLLFTETARVYSANTLHLTISSVLFLPLLIGISLAIATQVRRYRASGGIYQHQIRWLILGASSAILGIAGVVLGYLLLPSDYHILTAGLDEIGGVGFAVCLIFAVTRYRLYDIDLFVNRSLVYGGAAIGLALLFLALSVLLNQTLSWWLPNDSLSLAWVLAFFAVGMAFHPTRKALQHWIDRRIYGLRFDLNELALAHEKASVLDEDGQLVGKTIAGCQLLNLAGFGGMGEVYKGFRDGRFVAVKVMSQRLEDHSTLALRFEREAALHADLMHPNSVRLLDRGKTPEGYAYMVMEWIEGQSLGALLHERGRLSLDEIRPWLKDLAEPLSWMHQLGYLHRDLKPSNVMLRYNRDRANYEAVLLDFGLVRHLNDSADLTGEGAVGTIQYMAPEQIRQDQRIDARADVYALGVMVYEMLTGQLPYQGSVAQILFGHLQHPVPDIRDQDPTLSPHVSAALQRALSKDSADRFADVNSFLMALWG